MTDRVSKIILRGDISDLQAKLVAAGRSVSAVADKTTAATKESRKFRDGLSTVGDAAGKMALVTGAAFVGIVATAAKFEQGMSNIKAATHETAQNMELLRDAALDAGAKTVFSATEATAAIENLAKAGVSTRDILGGGLDGALDLAAAGSIEVADAAEVAATAMTQFGLSGTEIPHVADLLAAAAGKAQGEVSDMAYALKQSGLVADQMGLSIEETTGGLAAFASAGLLGSDAGTSFKQALAALTPNSAKASKAMNNLGINAFDAQGKFIGLAEFAGNLRSSLADLTDQQRLATLETVFGSDAVRAAAVLYDQGAAGIQEWIDKVNDQGYAAETAALRLDNLKGDVEQLTGALETFLIGAGEGSQGPLRELTQGATDAVNALNGLPGPVKNTATSLLAITAVTGGAFWFGSKVIQGVANTRQALDNLGSSADSARGKLSAVGKGVSFVALIATLNELDRAFDDVFDRRLEGSDLDRSLKALAEGKVTGALADTFGEDLEKFGDQVIKANKFSSKIVDLVPDVLAGKTADAVNNIRDLDDALASLVESGEESTAADLFDRLAEAAAKSGISTKELQGRFEQYRIAVDNATPSTDFFSTSVSGLQGMLAGLAPKVAANADALAASAEAHEVETKAIEGNIDAMREKRDLALAAEQAEIGYQRALRSAAEALKENGKTLDITTEAGAKNKEALLDVADSWNALSDQEKNQKGARQQAIDTFAALAEQMGMGEKAARNLARKLLEIPPKTVAEAVVDTAGAERQLNRWIKAQSGRKILFRADGSIQFTGGGDKAFAVGGYTGDGGKFEPKGVVHGGEFVFSKEATNGNLLMLERLHRDLRGYANGGRVGEQHAARSYTTVNHHTTVAQPVRQGPLVHIDTVRPNDMREVVAYGRNVATTLSHGGEAF